MAENIAAFLPNYKIKTLQKFCSGMHDLMHQTYCNVKVVSTQSLQVVNCSRCSNEDLSLPVGDHFTQLVVAHYLLGTPPVSLRVIGPA